MKTPIFALFAVVILLPLTACVSVRHEEPAAVSTTTTSRHVSTVTPETTTVAHTTVY